MTGRAPLHRSTPTEDAIDRILRERYGFRRLSQSEVDTLSEEDIECLEDEYDATRAREINKAVRKGRMEVVSGRELREETGPDMWSERTAGNSRGLSS